MFMIYLNPFYCIFSITKIEELIENYNNDIYIKKKYFYVLLFNFMTYEPIIDHSCDFIYTKITFVVMWTDLGKCYTDKQDSI